MKQGRSNRAGKGAWLAAGLLILISTHGHAGPVYSRLSVDADPCWDRVRIILDAQSSPSTKRITYLNNPPRVQVELGGELDGIESPNVECEDAYLRSVRIETVGKGRCRLTATLAAPTTGAKVDFYRQPNQRFLYIDINRPARYQQPAWTPRELEIARAKGIPVVVVDAGHGGYDTGATSRLRKSLKEKDVVLDVTKQVVRFLRANGKVYPVTTRSGDYYPTLDERVELIGETGAGLLVSVHADSTVGNNSASGFAAWVLKSDRNDVAAEARRILKYGWRSQLAKLPLSKQNLVISRQAVHVETETEIAAQTVLASLDRSLDKMAPDFENRGIKHDNLKVLRHYYAPSILLELGFLSNLSDSRRLDKKAFRDQLAAGIAAGIEGYFEQRSRRSLAPLSSPPNLPKAQELPGPPDFSRTSPTIIASSEGEQNKQPVAPYQGDTFEYVVKRGDSLGRLARQFKVTESDILSASGLPTKRRALYPGDRLRIPVTEASTADAEPVERAGNGTHVVKSSDSLLTIALRYGTTIEEIRELNGWPSDRTPRAGETVRVPVRGSKTAASGEGNPSALALEGLDRIWTSDANPATNSAAQSDQTSGPSQSSHSVYRVQAGDTLSTIADRFGLDCNQLRVLNGLKSDALIRVGQELKVPTGKASAGFPREDVEKTTYSPDQLAETSDLLSGNVAN
jgi:N-acetylmuramoyl-L-alanine amidase